MARPQPQTLNLVGLLAESSASERPGSSRSWRLWSALSDSWPATPARRPRRQACTHVGLSACLCGNKQDLTKSTLLFLRNHDSCPCKVPRQQRVLSSVRHSLQRMAIGVLSSPHKHAVSGELRHAAGDSTHVRSVDTSFGSSVGTRMWTLQNQSKTRFGSIHDSSSRIHFVGSAFVFLSSDCNIGACDRGFQRCAVFPHLVGIVPPEVLRRVTPGFVSKATACAELSRFFSSLPSSPSPFFPLPYLFPLPFLPFPSIDRSIHTASELPTSALDSSRRARS